MRPAEVTQLAPNLPFLGCQLKLKYTKLSVNLEAIIINIIIMDVRAATWPNVAHLLMEAEVSRQLQAGLSHLHSDASPIMTQLRGRCQFCTGHTIHTVTLAPRTRIHEISRPMREGK